MFLVLVQGNLFAQVADRPVHSHPGIAALSQVIELLPVLSFPAADDGGEELQSSARGEGHDLVDDLLDGLGVDLLPALVAVRTPRSGEEQAEVIVDFGYRADGGAGILGSGLLLDGDGRGEALNRIHVGLFHLLQELAGVGRKGLHVTPLPFGIDGIEGQG